MISRSVHHVSLMVQDLDEALDFYAGVLGLRRRSDRPTSLGPGVWLDIGDLQLHLIEGTPPPAQGQHFAVLVDDLDTTREQLLGRGVAVSEPATIGAARQAFLHDPSGNVIELHEATPHRTSPETANDGGWEQ